MGRKKTPSVFILSPKIQVFSWDRFQDFSNSKEVSEELRKQVLERADELGFRPQSTRKKSLEFVRHY